jgi:hypothetical protein
VCRDEGNQTLKVAEKRRGTTLLTTVFSSASADTSWKAWVPEAKSWPWSAESCCVNESSHLPVAGSHKAVLVRLADSRLEPDLKRTPGGCTAYTRTLAVEGSRAPPVLRAPCPWFRCIGRPSRCCAGCAFLDSGSY